MHLDPAIRDWVLFPIMVVMILVGVLRHLASVLMQSRPKTLVKGIRETCVHFRNTRAQRLKNVWIAVPLEEPAF